jgi:hypothetical protein
VPDVCTANREAAVNARRKTRVSQALEHPAYPWVATIVGVALFIVAAVMMYREPAEDKGHMIFQGALMAVAVLLLPGVASRLAASIKLVGGSIAEAWRARQ